MYKNATDFYIWKYIGGIYCTVVFHDFLDFDLYNKIE